MIVRQISFKGKYETLIDYILRGASHDEDFTIFRNTKIGTDRDSIVNSFIQNDKYRKRVKTRCQHVILSYHYKSNPSQDALWKLTNEFLRLRGMDNAVVFGKCHSQPSSGCVHVHLAVSQNLYLRDKSVRVAKKELKQQNRELELYQQEKFPELNDSIVFLKEKVKSQEPYQKANGKTHTNRLIDIVNELAEKAVHLQNLHELLDEHPELEPYSRGNHKYYGILWKNNTRYRLKRLITPERYSSLERLELMREVMERSDRNYGQENSLTR